MWTNFDRLKGWKDSAVGCHEKEFCQGTGTWSYDDKDGLSYWQFFCSDIQKEEALLLDSPSSIFKPQSESQLTEWEEVCNLEKSCQDDLSCVNFFSEYKKNDFSFEVYKTGYMCADPDGVCASPYITSFTNQEKDGAAPSKWHFRCDLQDMNLGVKVDLTNEAVLKIDLDKFLGPDGTFDLLGQMETTGNATSYKIRIAASLAALIISI